MDSVVEKKSFRFGFLSLCLWFIWKRKILQLDYEQALTNKFVYKILYMTQIIA